MVDAHRQYLAGTDQVHDDVHHPIKVYHTIKQWSQLMDLAFNDHNTKGRWNSLALKCC